MTFQSDQVRSLGGGGGIGRGPLLLAGIAVVAALAIASAPAESQGPAMRVAIVAAGVLAAWRVLGRSAAVTASSPERFETALLEPVVAPTEISGLRSVETDLRMSSANAFGLEFRLKPLLRDLARWRLARNHAVDLDAAPDAARRILGEPLWRLTLAAEERPDFRAPGSALADVRAAIDRLERI